MPIFHKKHKLIIKMDLEVGISSHVIKEGLFIRYAVNFKSIAKIKHRLEIADSSGLSSAYNYVTQVINDYSEIRPGPEYRGKISVKGELNGTRFHSVYSSIYSLERLLGNMLYGNLERQKALKIGN